MPLLAFVLAAASALAFNVPGDIQGEYGSENGTEWYDVSPATVLEGVDYQCNEVQVESHCTYSQPSDTSTPIGENDREQFELLNEDLDPIEP